MKAIAPESKLLAVYQRQRSYQNERQGHAYPYGAIGDANGLANQCSACGEYLRVVPAKDGVRSYVPAANCPGQKSNSAAA
jgi:hypothetical protein